MSLIPCTEPCAYQHDGICTLSRAAAGNGQENCSSRCLNFVLRSDEGGDRLTDV